MNGGDKILSHINSDCDEKVKEINAESDKVCAEIIAEGKREADKAALEIVEKAKLKAKQIKEASKSRSELEVRNSLLKRRREEIDITIDAVLEYIKNLDDKTYFDTIYSIAKKLDGKSGEIFLNQKDLSRLPDDFKQRLAQSGVNASVSETAVNIDGGFILKCGNIEENMDFTAMIADKRDEIEDLVNRELFTE